MALVAPGPRPRLRGFSHQIAAFVAALSGGALVIFAASERARFVAFVYAVLLTGMLTVSATLHGKDWSPRQFGWLRRADHAMIFACIAGTYTPFCVLAVPQPAGTKLLVLAWIAAGLGIARAALWPHAPRAITAACFVAVGWVAAAYFPEVHAGLEPVAFKMLMIGGVWFTVGALVYLVKWPDPWPTVFGYHEVFHLMIIIGCACHFITVARCVV